MFSIERQEKIFEYINEKKEAKVSELSQIFNISNVTIRHDINTLAQKRLIIKTHGGALSLERRINGEIPYSSKFQKNVTEKRLIGKEAAQLIENNDVIILDAGSTTFEIAKNIYQKNVTVITNDLKIGMECANNPKINLIMTGGALEPLVYTLMGDETVRFLSNIYVDKLFLGCDAYDLQTGISNRTLQEISIKKTMIASAKEIILVTDHTKIRKKVFAHVCDPFVINTLVIDSMNEKDIAYLTQNGVQVILAGEARSSDENIERKDENADTN